MTSTGGSTNGYYPDSSQRGCVLSRSQRGCEPMWSVRRSGVIVITLVIAVLIGWYALRVLLRPGPGCVITAPDGSTRYTLTPVQADNAATIAGVGVGMGIPDHAVSVALATAMQESGLRNLPGGDRDSAGLFQQRPSEGWG